ncbi:hypothetical protein FRC00_006852, partial [Tulasnella sp. 408]
ATVSKLSKTHFSPVDITNKINRFYSYASQSLFFTKSLTEITAVRRTADLRIIPIWLARSTREAISQSVPSDIDAANVLLTMKPPQSPDEIAEHWVVTRNEIAQEELPSRLQALFPLHRLPTPTFALAAHVSAKNSLCNSRLFSTLPLPVSISLPVHIHATWILAQDRRSIRYDAPDAANRRPDDTLYNVHLLEKGIAPLYVKTLALLLRHHPKQVRRFWPGKVKDDPSQTVTAELYNQIISTSEPVLLSAQGQPIAPVNSIIHLSAKAPTAVRKILSGLKVHNYVPTPYMPTSSREDWGSLRFDRGEEVSKILRENAIAIQALWQATAFTPQDIISVWRYLLEEEESLNGIPLLPRGDGQLVEFQNSGNGRIFASHRTELTRLFGPSTVVSPGISDLTAQSLAKIGLNVESLDPRGMRDLLQLHSQALIPADSKIASGAQLDWHKDLLKFLASPGCPVKVQDLPDLPLLPAVGRELVVSLNLARGGKIWWRCSYEDPALTAVLLQLGVITVDELPGEVQRSDSNELTRILQLFGRLNFSSQEVLRRVTPGDWEAFVQYLNPWLRDFYLSRLSNADHQTLNTLPFFKGRQGTNPLSYVPASQVMMLPDAVPFDAVAQYLPSETTFAASSQELSAVLRTGRNTQNTLSFPSLLKKLRIPRQLSQNDDASFSSLLPLVAAHDTDQDARQGREVLRRASWLWDYVNTAPQQLRAISFDSIRGLRFVPRHSQRHPSDSDFDLHARDLPSVVSLDELSAPNREAVVWTQRARFAAYPTAHLTAVYPAIGEPTAADVVRHLICVVNNVAPNHREPSILLSNIRSVYSWLKSNQANVKGLLKPLAKKPLWLNIADLNDWTWRAADELVFDLTYDVGGRFVVQKFLLPYRSLLVDAGAHEYRVANLSPPATSETQTPHSEVMRSGWNKLRKAGQLLDMCFKVEGQEIPAHRGMLAAMVPHFATAFSGPFRESIISADQSELPVYQIPQDETASAFAVRSLVDYVYTGAFSHPKFSNLDEASGALDDLLDLMELSHLWDVPNLSNQAVKAIVELRLIRFDNCEDVLGRAQDCQMQILVDVCQRTLEQN